ncbi:hypothetical protein D3C76_1429890 [compost metagenome]
MDDVIVTVLSVLDLENHQKGDDRGRRIDDQLPGIVVMKPGARSRPHGDQYHRDQECTRLARVICKPLAELREFHVGVQKGSHFSDHTDAGKFFFTFA